MMDLITPHPTIEMVKVVEENGQMVTKIVEVKNLVWEIFMDYYYGPCWRCEGMGV